jgi:hypothetical protein
MELRTQEVSILMVDGVVPPSSFCTANIILYNCPLSKRISLILFGLVKLRANNNDDNDDI